jgi:purine nucleoside permease
MSGWGLLRLALGLLAILSGTPAAAGPAGRPIEVRVVVIATWEAFKDGQDLTGELHDWRTKWPLTKALPFPAGIHPLLYDPKTHVLAVLTGEATARAAVSITALGTDPRFDLSHAYWILAGTAGVDPAVASAGSTAWERYVVDGDLGQELDPRDAPADWPTGMVPNERSKPYEAPAPSPHGDWGIVAYALNRGLVDWAYAQTRRVALPDDATLQALRAPYAGLGGRPPFVFEGDGLMTPRVWYGPRMNDWAERWVAYWTGGQGVFAMSAEEDTGVMQALTALSGAGKVDLKRVLMLRGGSDYSVGPPTLTPAQFLARETEAGFPANQEALDDLYAVASPVARYLAEHWSETRTAIPTSRPPPN